MAERMFLRFELGEGTGSIMIYLFVMFIVACLTIVTSIHILTQTFSEVEFNVELSCSGVSLINKTFNLNNSDCYGNVHVKAPLKIAEEFLRAQ